MDMLKSRRAGALLHWTAAVSLLLTLAASGAGMRAALAWIFAGAAALWVLRTVLAGPMAHPVGLSGPARAAHLALHRGLLALVAVTAAAGVVPQAAGWHGPLVYATLALAAAHLAFNLWRAAGGARVFGRMLP